MQLNKKRLALLKERAARRKDDPLFGWTPFATQVPFLESVLMRLKNENWFIGANRSGKSDVGANAGSVLARFGDQSDNPKYVGAKGSNIQVRDRATSGWVVSLDFPSSRDIVQPKYFDNGFVPPGATHKPFIPPHEVAGYNISDKILKLKNGSIIGFKSADSGRTKFQGTEKDWIHFDEEPPKGVYEESVIRVGASPLVIFGTCTLLPPEGVVGGVTWVYSDIVKPIQNGTKDAVGLFGGSIYDNPYILRSEIARLEAIYPEDSTQRKIRLNGELLPGLGGSRVYTAFTRQLNVKQLDNAIVMRRPLIWTWDFNVEPMITHICQRDGMIFQVFRELVLDEGSIPEMCEWFKELYPQHHAEVHIYGDATGKGRTGQTGKSDYWTIMNSMRDYGVPVKQKVPESNPHVRDRINAVNLACKNEVGEINLHVDPSCDELIDDFEQVLADPVKGIKKTSNKKDPYFRRTHASDGIGYWISKVAPVRIGRNDLFQSENIIMKNPSYARSH